MFYNTKVVVIDIRYTNVTLFLTSFAQTDRLFPKIHYPIMYFE